MNPWEERTFSTVTVFEWSEKIEDMLPDDTIFINITINEDLTRSIEIRGMEL